MRGASLTEGVQDLARLGPASVLLLGEDESPVGDDVELAVLAADGLSVVALSLKLGRETRGPFVIPASDGAVEDLDAHGAASLARIVQ